MRLSSPCDWSDEVSESTVTQISIPPNLNPLDFFQTYSITLSALSPFFALGIVVGRNSGGTEKEETDSNNEEEGRDPG